MVLSGTAEDITMINIVPGLETRNVCEDQLVKVLKQEVSFSSFSLYSWKLAISESFNGAAEASLMPLFYISC